MSLYVEDDNYVDPSPPVQPLRPLLRFRHNIEKKFIVNPKWSFDRNFAHIIETENYECNQIDDLHFYGQVFVPITSMKIYTGTTATLFAPDGNFIAHTTTKLHPQDQFCRLIGRQVAQQKLIKCFSSPMFIPDSLSIEILARLLNNKTTQLLNW